MSDQTNYIQRDYRISEEEFLLLEEKFGKLFHFVAWNLIQQNSKNNLPEDEGDISQDIRMGCLKAACYYKRQTYIEKGLELLISENTEEVNQLREDWHNRARHGAGIMRFGLLQERRLDELLLKYPHRPRKDAPLNFDNRFTTYAKAIIYNTCKALGKKVSKEKSIRSGQVSLSEFSEIM